MLGSRLNGILHDIEAGRTPTRHAMNFLAEKGLVCLNAFATGVLRSDKFYEQAEIEKEARIGEMRRLTAIKASEMERKSVEQDAVIKSRFEAMENDPVLRSRREAKKLRETIVLGFVESDIYPRVMKLVAQVDAGRRLSSEEVMWFQTRGRDCWTPELRSAHHRLEAAALTREWELNRDPWTAVNACADWRKGKRPNEAIELTAKLLALPNLEPKLHSALCTTRGGAMRDLDKLEEARDLGYEAQRLAPKDFRPCTLLGAVYMELGDFKSGQDWYQKAEELGAKRDSVDQDIRGVLARCKPEVRDALGAFLLSQDATRFAWVQKGTFRKIG